MTEVSQEAIVIAKLVQRAAHLHESSYSDEGVPPYRLGGKYFVSIDEAVKLACSEYGEPALQFVVNALLNSYWNDSLDWAKEVADGSH